LIIQTADLDREGMRIESPLDLGPLTSDSTAPIKLSKITVTGHVYPTERGLVFRGRLVGHAQLNCARCLEAFSMEISREFDLQYATVPPSGQEKRIPDEDMDLGFLEPDGGLDLAQVATEQIYLELPMKPLCASSCKGLCSTCGSNLNTEECGCATLAS
jgi:uncharacterized protein